MLDSKLTSMKGIGPRRAELFGKLGLTSFYDLLVFFPRAYKNYSVCESAANCSHSQDAALHLELEGEAKLARLRRGLDILSVSAHDESGKIRLVWYNQGYRKTQIEENAQIYACGRIDLSKGRKMINPMLSQSLPGILPVYPLVRGLNQHILRESVKKAIDACLDELSELLPEEIRLENALPSLRDAIMQIHFPEDLAELESAKKRMAFENMLLFRLMIERIKQQRMNSKGIPFAPAEEATFLESLPFTATRAQKRCIHEIAEDMAKLQPMNRLLQGDVGSGKTAVAIYAMKNAVKNGYQAVLLAPTELLARQHFRLCQSYFGNEALLLLGGMKKSEKEEAYKRIASGEAKAVVGTHTLLQEGISFSKLGLVVTDEQHRFGVEQRAKLKSQGTPDMLIMSATPIPRTLTLLLYGDLELSVLDELPPGRKPILTRMVPEEKREKMYAFIVEQIKKGRQVYAVCPLIEDSEDMENVICAKALYSELKGKLPVRVGMVHGQMKNAEKQEALDSFYSGKTDLLVSTTVIEVGIDVPNASVMVIENAECFGLAQLHQLRGRVGRGAEASYCFLMSGTKSDAARERLLALTKTQNGFELAQKDLEMRGPGELLGQRQHGLDEWSSLSLAPDMEVLYAADKTAKQILSDAALMKKCEALIEKADAALIKNQKRIAMN